jgi:hypothetical protein
MNAGFCRIFVAGMLAASLIPTVGAQPAFDKPDIAPDDFWQFRVDREDGTANKWSRRVLRVLGDNRLEVQYQNAQVHYYDHAMNYVGTESTGDVAEYARFPMRVGDSWSFAKRYSDPRHETRGDSKVVAFESVTVPAGVFDCFRVETSVSNASAWSSTEVNLIRWHCPAIKWIAKQQYRTRTNSRIGLGSASENTSELVRYKLAP